MSTNNRDCFHNNLAGNFMGQKRDTIQIVHDVELKRDRAEVLKELWERLKNDPGSVHDRDSYGNTPLHWAANWGFLEGVRLLLEYGADINAQNTDGETPLHRALRGSRKEQAETLEFLLEHGADPNIADHGGSTPLFLAGWDNMEAERAEKMVRLLLTHGADPNVRDKRGDTPLHEMRATRAMRALLEHGVQEIDARNNKGETPLLVAVRSAQAGTEKLLIAHGADKNVRDEEGHTLLHLAVRDEDNYVAPVKRLIAAGADVNARDIHGYTPLHQAAGAHFFAAARLLIGAGAEINARDAEGHTPLYLVENGIYLGQNPYYCPPPEGEGEPKYFEAGKQKMTRILRNAGARS
jgi:ankyrin repeat protein